MLFTSVLAFTFLLPLELISFGKSLIANSFFVSNFFFWSESGYFDPDSKFKPLLHTWSLSVEEQFYVFFPLLILLFKKYSKKTLFLFMSFFFILSLALSEWGWRNNSNLNFFFSATRAWEILLGVFIAITSLKVNQEKLLTNNSLSLLGLFMVIGSLFFFDELTPHPSRYTLIPLLGTCLLILYSQKGTVVHQILSNKLLVSWGLISYSLYLFHLPIFIFAEIYIGEKPDVLIYFLLIFLSILLSWLSWKYWELLFRDRRNFSSRTILGLSLSSLIMFVVLGLFVISSEGFASSYNEEDQSIIFTQEGNYVSRNKHLRQVNFEEDKFKIFIIGDSFSEDFIKFSIGFDSLPAILNPSKIATNNKHNENKTNIIENDICILEVFFSKLLYAVIAFAVSSKCLYIVLFIFSLIIK